MRDVSIILLRGVDTSDTIVDSDGDHNSVTDSEDNNYGVAIAPSINTVNQGIVIAAFMFDDPHESTIINDGYKMLVSESKGDDGLAVGVSETDGMLSVSIIYVSFNLFQFVCTVLVLILPCIFAYTSLYDT